MNTLKYSFLLLAVAFFNPCIAQYDASSETQAAPHQVLIEGATFDMGFGTYVTRRVTVSSFYIDATEVWNKEYRSFVAWMQKHEPQVSITRLMPDTSLWVRYIEGEVGEQLAKDYYRNAAFDYHPVVGVNWEQAQLFSKWRSDRVNQAKLEEEGYWTAALKKKFPAFYTANYLEGQYGEPARVHLFPDYRLASEAEWELAGYGIVGNRSYEESLAQQHLDYQSTSKNKKHFDKKIKLFRKTVESHTKKNPVPSYYNQEKYKLPKHIFEGEINRKGLFNMNDNISEWVQDIYRERTPDNTELKPFRGDVFKDVGAEVDNNSILDCPPTKLHHTASIQKGDKPQFYTATATFYDNDGQEISYEQFYKLQCNPISPYQIVEADEEDHIHVRVLSKDEFDIYKEKESKRLNAELLNKLNPLRVYKGANVGDEQGLKGPGYRYSEREIGPYNFPIGFRCAMTKVGNLYSTQKGK